MKVEAEIPFRLPEYDGRFAVLEQRMTEVENALEVLRQHVADAGARDEAEDAAAAAKFADLNAQLADLRQQVASGQTDAAKLLGSIAGIQDAVDGLDKAEPAAPADSGTGTGTGTGTPVPTPPTGDAGTTAPADGAAPTTTTNP